MNRKLFLTSLLAFVCSIATMPAQNNAASGIVVKGVKPRAWATGPDGKQFKLVDGMTLPEGTRIQTGKGGSVDVVLGNAGSAFQVTGNSDLTIQKASAATATAPAEVKISVKFGGMVANTTEMKTGTKFEVTTPNGVLNAKASEFALNSDGSVVVKTGSVDVQTSGKTTTVAADQHYSPPSTTDTTTPGTVQPATTEEKKALENKFAEVSKVETSGQTFAGTKTGTDLTSGLKEVGDKNSNK